MCFYWPFSVDPCCVFLLCLVSGEVTLSLKTVSSSPSNLGVGYSLNTTCFYPFLSHFYFYLSSTTFTWFYNFYSLSLTSFYRLFFILNLKMNCSFLSLLFLSILFAVSCPESHALPTCDDFDALDTCALNLFIHGNPSRSKVSTTRDEIVQQCA